MINIDYIMELIDWKKSKNDQDKGVSLSREAKNINVFLQPCNEKYNKNVWDNCARILSERSDKELTPYLIELLEWLQDLNWPGALTIAERLKIFSGEKLKDAFITCFNRAVEADNDDGLVWLDYLSELLDNKELKELLPKEILETLQKHYHNWGAWYEDD